MKLSKMIHKAIEKDGHAYPVGTRNWEDGIQEDTIHGLPFTFFYFDKEEHGSSDMITIPHSREAYEFYKAHLQERV